MKRFLPKFFLSLLFFSILICSMPCNLNAQNWTFRNGFGNSTGTDRISGLALDAAGNVYATGSYSGPISFGTVSLSWTGNLDGFVAKFSPAGVCIWAIRFNGPGTAQDQGLGIATNGTSVFVGGVFQTSLSINGAAAINGYGGIDGFMMKLDAATGNTQWATVFGSGSTDAVQAMCIDNAGNAYATGYFSSNSTYPTANFGSFTRSSNGVAGTDAYVTKIDGTTGNIVWVSTGGMPSYNDNVSNSGLAYAPAQNAIVMVGSTQSPGLGYTATYNNPSPIASLSLPSKGGLDVIVTKLDAATGVFQNALSVGGPSSSNEEALTAAYDASTGYVCLAGYMNTGALTFGTTTVPPYGSDDIFYTAYDPATNNFMWAKSAGSTIQDRAQSIGTNGVGGVFITGRFRNTLSAPTATTPLTVTSSRTSSADEIYLLQVNSATGNAENLVAPQGDATVTTGDIGTGIASSSSGVTWLGGMFGGTIIIPPFAPLSTTGGTTADILLASYTNGNPLPVHLLSFSAQKENSEIHLFWNTADEIDNDHFDIERSRDGRNFEKVGTVAAMHNATSGNYSWTDRSVAGLNTGKIYYRLKIVSTSDEINYSPIVAVYLDHQSAVVIGAAPNPFMNNLNIHFNVPRDNKVSIRISDMNGRILSKRDMLVSRGSSTVNLSDANKLSRGVYTISVEYEGSMIHQQIVKQ